ncbi:hypothetical protein GWK47_037322 [Chionoecetes opilio]|uniref:Uncharacterized protein n=1 Tax=Chionoecetes opilio TaxID=41210 RepID=A0A8J4YLU6_CHIOP|nr:hypothetical protein GWK47_037322 [Chionoecetes opilio]
MFGAMLQVTYWTVKWRITETPAHPKLSWLCPLTAHPSHSLNYPDGSRLRVAVNLDTGMSRYGVQPQDLRPWSPRWTPSRGATLTRHVAAPTGCVQGLGTTWTSFDPGEQSPAFVQFFALLEAVTKRVLVCLPGLASVLLCCCGSANILQAAPLWAEALVRVQPIRPAVMNGIANLTTGWSDGSVVAQQQRSRQKGEDR